MFDKEFDGEEVMPREMTPMETPVGSSEAYNLMTLLLRIQQVVQDTHMYAYEAEVHENESLAAFFRQVGETHNELVGQTQEMIDQLEQPSREAT